MIFARRGGDEGGAQREAEQPTKTSGVRHGEGQSGIVVTAVDPSIASSPSGPGPMGIYIQPRLRNPLSPLHLAAIMPSIAKPVTRNHESRAATQAK